MAATYKINARVKIAHGWPNLTRPINHAFSGASDRLVPLLQELSENRKVLYRVLCGLGVGLNIYNVRWRVLRKILLEGAPGTGQDPVVRIKTRD